MMKLLGCPTILAVLVALLCFTEAFQQPYIAKSTNFRSRVGPLSLFGFLNDGKKALVKSLAGEYNQGAIQDRINGLVNANQVFMFSFTTCPYCLKAKSVLDGLGAKYTVVELDTDPDGKAIRAEMADLIGRTSVPAIWIGGKFVGGCNDGPMGGVVKLNESGELQTMLQGVGAM